MTASEKFCLKWNDFQKNVSSSFKEIREDFCDVTLMGEGHTQVEAHKVILAASSSFFHELLKKSQHPHPLLYLKGIKGCQLSAVVDFMYHGEVSIGQGDLSDFLLVAEELQLKGVSGTEKGENYKEPGKIQTVKSKNVAAFPNDPQIHSNSRLDEYINHDNEFIVEEKCEMSNSREIVETYANEIKADTNIEELDLTINSMVCKLNGIWTCLQCGKTNKCKRNLGNHIEAKHIKGAAHPCQQCGKLFRSRNSLHTLPQKNIIFSGPSTLGMCT